MALTAKNDDLTLDEVLGLRLWPLAIKEVLKVSKSDGSTLKGLCTVYETTKHFV